VDPGDGHGIHRQREIRTRHGVLATCSVDLVLEPLAYYTGIWTWLQPYTLQIYFGSTVANALVWAGMCLIGIKFWEANINAR
jgi:uncharacterized membrane protein